ncbi:MAG TPA: hypothetical protein VEB18_01455 [Candidatus Paceibacterota bacterium]|nr:hypothetical protein [Candidatus Paceibacterota bacterium]
MQLRNLIIAILCGFLVGAIVTYHPLALNNPDYWALGAIAGGVIGWIVYDVKAFFAAVQRAAMRTWADLTRERVREPKERFVLSRLERSYVFWCEMKNFAINSSFMALFFLVVGLGTYELADGEIRLSASMMMSSVMYGFVMTLYALSVLFAPLFSGGREVVRSARRNELNPEQHLADRIAILKKEAGEYNVVAITYLLVAHGIPAAIFWVVRGAFLLLKYTYLFSACNGRMASFIGVTAGLASAAFLNNLPLGLGIGLFTGFVLWSMQFGVERVRAWK